MPTLNLFWINSSQRAGVHFQYLAQFVDRLKSSLPRSDRSFYPASSTGSIGCWAVSLDSESRNMAALVDMATGFGYSINITVRLLHEMIRVDPGLLSCIHAVALEVLQERQTQAPRPMGWPSGIPDREPTIEDLSPREALFVRALAGGNQLIRPTASQFRALATGSATRLQLLRSLFHTARVDNSPRSIFGEFETGDPFGRRRSEQGSPPYQGAGWRPPAFGESRYAPDRDSQSRPIADDDDNSSSIGPTADDDDDDAVVPERRPVKVKPKKTASPALDIGGAPRSRLLLNKTAGGEFTSVKTEPTKKIKWRPDDSR